MNLKQAMFKKRFYVLILLGLIIGSVAWAKVQADRARMIPPGHQELTLKVGSVERWSLSYLGFKRASVPSMLLSPHLATDSSIDFSDFPLSVSRYASRPNSASGVHLSAILFSTNFSKRSAKILVAIFSGD
jgi:hypothetical protein